MWCGGIVVRVYVINCKNFRIVQPVSYDLACVQTSPPPSGKNRERGLFPDFFLREKGTFVHRLLMILVLRVYVRYSNGRIKETSCYSIVHAVMVFKSLNNLASEYLCSEFIPTNVLVNYPLRGLENNLALPHPRTNCFKRRFSYSGARLWNSLPLDHLRQAGTLNSFKAKLHCYNFSNYLTASM